MSKLRTHRDNISVQRTLPVYTIRDSGWSLPRLFMSSLRTRSHHTHTHTHCAGVSGSVRCSRGTMLGCIAASQHGVCDSDSERALITAPPLLSSPTEAEHVREVWPFCLVWDKSFHIITGKLLARCSQLHPLYLTIRHLSPHFKSFSSSHSFPS